MSNNTWRQQLTDLQNQIQDYDEKYTDYGDATLDDQYWTGRKPLTDALEAHYDKEGYDE